MTQSSTRYERFSSLSRSRSDERQCAIRKERRVVRPGLIFGGCHGDDEKLVFDELCRIVEDAIEVYRREGNPLPPPTSGRDFANKMQNVA